MTLSLVLLAPCLTGGVHLRDLRRDQRVWLVCLQVSRPHAASTVEARGGGGEPCSASGLAHFVARVCPESWRLHFPKVTASPNKLVLNTHKNTQTTKATQWQKPLFLHLQNDSAGFQICLMSQDFYFKISSALFSLWIPQNTVPALLSVLFRLLMGGHYASLEFRMPTTTFPFFWAKKFKQIQISHTNQS